MSEDGTELDDGKPDDAGAPRKRLLPALLLGGACLAAGGAVGATTLGSALAPLLADRAEAQAEDSATPVPSALHLIDNLVVNPARSRGTRFLLVSVAVQVRPPATTALVAERDVELRAALLLVLGARSVDELTDIEQRALIVDEVRETIEEVLGPDVVHDVFIPQFVIQ
jgi:flagellar FliL protein